MSSRFTLSTKIAVLLLAFLAIGFINAGIIFSVTQQMKAAGRTINLAGRQRMLSQKMSKEAFALLALPAGTDPGQAVAGINETVTLFDRTLKGLSDGDAELDLAPATDPAIRAKLDRLHTAWGTFKEHFAVLASQGVNSPVGREALASIGAENLPLLQAMNEIVTDYESLNNLATIQRLQSVLLAIQIMVVAGAWFFVGREITRPLREITSTVAAGAHHINAFSAEVAAAAGELADRAAGQAAALEESSASLEEINSMTRNNAASTGQANDRMQATAHEVDRANEAIGRMNNAMAEINAASQQIGAIIKTIDDIAFQTNLLALNAAVEAARAGSAGAGFAVVADEVRNLAQRSAGAARDTSGLIDEVVGKISEGSRLVEQATASFASVATAAGQVADLIEDIAAANREQSLGVEQISGGIHNLDETTQRNAATAEETSATAQELHDEANQLMTVVARLTMVVEGDQKTMPKR